MYPFSKFITSRYFTIFSLSNRSPLTPKNKHDTKYFVLELHRSNVDETEFLFRNVGNLHVRRSLSAYFPYSSNTRVWGDRELVISQSVCVYKFRPQIVMNILSGMKIILHRIFVIVIFKFVGWWSSGENIQVFSSLRRTQNIAIFQVSAIKEQKIVLDTLNGVFVFSCG